MEMVGVYGVENEFLFWVVVAVIDSKCLSWFLFL